MSAPRKTVQERVLFAELKGFYSALKLFEDAWRPLAWTAHQFKRTDPVAELLWKLITEAQAQIKPVDDAWRKLNHPRVEAAHSAQRQLRKKSKKRK